MDPTVELFPGVGHKEVLPGMTGGMPWKQALPNPEIGQVNE